MTLAHPGLPGPWGLFCQCYMGLAQRAAPTPHLSSSEALSGVPGEVVLGTGEDCIVTQAGQTLDTAGSQKAIGERLILESWSRTV